MHDDGMQFAEALRSLTGVKDPTAGEAKVFVYGTFLAMNRSATRIDLWIDRPGGLCRPQRISVLRSAIRMESLEISDTFLIEISAAYAQILELSSLILTNEEVEEYRRRIPKFSR